MQLIEDFIVVAVVFMHLCSKTLCVVQILGEDDESDDSGVVHVSNEFKELFSAAAADLMKSDEEYARMLQVFL